MGQDVSCQSLQPTSFQYRAPLKPTNSRARGSHLADRLFPPWPSPNTLVKGSNTDSSEGAPNSPRASPVPSDAAVGAATPVVVITALTPLLTQGATPVFGGVSAPVSGSCPFTRTERRNHSHSMSLPQAASPLSRGYVHVEPRTHSMNTHQGIHFQSPKCLPPISPRPPIPAGAEKRLGGRH
jgi:hypothetical protein